MSLFTFESGTTIQFTFVSSIQPDAAPRFSVTDQTSTVLHSGTSLTSDATHYYALYTTVNSDNRFFTGEWLAKKTVSGSAYDFIKRFTFKVTKTDVP